MSISLGAAARPTQRALVAQVGGLITAEIHPPMPAAADDSADKMNKTLAMQPVLLAYGACISTVSPALTAYQLTRVYGKAVPPSQLARMSVAIFPHQTVLKCLQMNAATPVKEHLNPWFAFGVVGVLQARAS